MPGVDVLLGPAHGELHGLLGAARSGLEELLAETLGAGRALGPDLGHHRPPGRSEVAHGPGSPDSIARRGAEDAKSSRTARNLEPSVPYILKERHSGLRRQGGAGHVHQLRRKDRLELLQHIGVDPSGRPREQPLGRGPFGALERGRGVS